MPSDPRAAVAAVTRAGGHMARLTHDAIPIGSRFSRLAFPRSNFVASQVSRGSRPRIPPVQRTFTTRNRPDGEKEFVQKVKITRARGNLRSLIKTALLIALALAVYRHFVLEKTIVVVAKYVPEMEDDDDDDDAEEEEEEGEEEDEEEEGFFVPLPLTTRKIDPEPYAGDDPEWKEFIRISKDVALKKKIRLELVAIVKSVFQISGELTSRCGVPARATGYWLDIDYPYRPPPEFERLGILILDNAIALAAEPVDPETAVRMNRILYPWPVFHSTVAFASALLKQEFGDIRGTLGFGSKTGKTLPDNANGPNPQGSSQAQNADFDQNLQRVRQQASKRPEEVQDPAKALAAAEEKRERQPGSANPNSLPVSSSSSRPIPPPTLPGSSNDPSSEQQQPGFPWGFHKHTQERFAGPWREFRKTFVVKSREMRFYPPRGSIAVSGLVQLETPRAWVTIDVVGWYDPKAGKYDTKTMSMRLRKVSPRVLKPRKK